MMGMEMWIRLALCVLMVTFVTAASAGPAIELVRNGKPKASIVVSATPTRSAAFAAEELQYHILQITGVSLPVVTDAVPVRGPVVCVGASRVTEAMGIRANALRPGEYLIRYRPGRLVLMGCDDTSIAPYRSPWRLTDSPFGKALQFGAENANVSLGRVWNDAEGCAEAWVRFDDGQTVDGTILRVDSPSPWTYQILQRIGGTNRANYRLYDGDQVTSLESAELAPRWHHLQAEWSVQDGRVRLWVDGVLQSEAPYRLTRCGQSPVYVGGFPHAGSVQNRLQGAIAAVRLSVSPRGASGSPTERPEQDANTRYLRLFDTLESVTISGSGPDVLRAPGFFTRKGTMDAVYAFLERDCDVDWLTPGRSGLWTPSRKTLVVQGEDIKKKPRFSYRWMTPATLYLPTPDDPVDPNDDALWRYRTRQGGEPFWACHSFSGYYDRFLANHPEWFAQGHIGRPPQMCFTNDEFTAQVAADAAEYFRTGKAYPGTATAGPWYGLAPEDNNSWCRCERCEQMVDTSQKDNPQFSTGLRSRYWFDFVNRVARQVSQFAPRQRIATLAYWEYAYHPGIELEPNIGVMMCLHTRNWWCPSMEANDTRILTEWVSREGKRRPLYVWLYYNFPALNAQYESFRMFPGFFVHQMARQIALYDKTGIEGVFLEHSGEFNQTFVADQVELYVHWKLLQDPAKSVDVLINRFFDRYYGAAAAPMRQLYLEIEQVFTDPMQYPESVRQSAGHRHHDRAITLHLATPARLARYRELLNRAYKLAHDDRSRLHIDWFDRALIRPLEEQQARVLEDASSPKGGIP